MAEKYKPGSDPKETPDSFVAASFAYGKTARGFLEYEEDAQRTIAELPTWQIAREDSRRKDTRHALEALGFVVTDEGSDLFYSVVPPEGWTKTTEGFWTNVFDADGKEHISQFFKGAIYDRRAFLNIK